MDRFNLVICSYETFRQDAQFFTKKQWNYCILDEGHLIKNPKTKLTQAVKSLNSKRRLILSGTPVQNDSLELWCLMDWLMPGYLGTEKGFNKQFNKPILQSRKSSNSQKQCEEEEMVAAGEVALSQLHKKVLPFILRRKKSDVLKDLPEKIISDRYVELSEIQSALYERILSESNQAQPLGLTNLNMLRRLCTHPSLILTKGTALWNEMNEQFPGFDDDLSFSPKLALLKELLEESELQNLKTGNKIIIFAQYLGTLDLIESKILKIYFPELQYTRLDGAKTISQKQKAITDFQENPTIQIILISTRAGGLGINLNRANIAIFMESDWNPSVDAQAMDRAHRIGAKRSLLVYRLLVIGTLEEKIMKYLCFFFFWFKRVFFSWSF